MLRIIFLLIGFLGIQGLTAQNSYLGFTYSGQLYEQFGNSKEVQLIIDAGGVSTLVDANVNENAWRSVFGLNYRKFKPNGHSLKFGLNYAQSEWNTKRVTLLTDANGIVIDAVFIEDGAITTNHFGSAYLNYGIPILNVEKALQIFAGLQGSLVYDWQQNLPTNNFDFPYTQKSMGIHVGIAPEAVYRLKEDKLLLHIGAFVPVMKISTDQKRLENPVLTEREQLTTGSNYELFDFLPITASIGIEWSL